MKQKNKLISKLNQILVEELKNVNQNTAYPLVCDKLDSEEVDEEIEKIMTEELKHAEWLIKRIVFLEVSRTHRSSINFNLNNTQNVYLNVKNVV